MKFFFSFFLMLVGVYAHAQPKAVKPAEKINDAEAGKILKNLKAKFESTKAAKLAFTLELNEADSKQNSTEKGTLILQGIDKFRLATTEQEVVCDGKTVWTHNLVDKEIQISSYSKKSRSMLPIQMILDYEKNYHYRIKPDAEGISKNQKMIELVPIDKKNALFKIDILVDVTKGTLVYSKMYEKSGARFLYTITLYDESYKPTASDFVFNPKNYPKEDVIDLR